MFVEECLCFAGDGIAAGGDPPAAQISANVGGMGRYLNYRKSSRAVCPWGRPHRPYKSFGVGEGFPLPYAMGFGIYLVGRGLAPAVRYCGRTQFAPTRDLETYCRGGVSPPEILLLRVAKRHRGSE